jgi:hypothetical protein
MGDHPDSKEVILLTLPWPEPTELIERLQNKFPDAEVRYKQITWRKGAATQEVLPDGMSTNGCLHTKRCSRLIWQ